MCVQTALPAFVEEKTTVGMFRQIVREIEIVVAEQALGCTAVHRDAIGAQRIEATRFEIDPTAVPRPGGHLIGSLVEGQLRDRTAAYGHDEYVGVPVLPAGKGHPLAVGRYLRVRFNAVHCREAIGQTTVGRYAPDIPVVAEINGLGVRTGRRIVHKIEVGLLGGQAGAAKQKKKEQVRTIHAEKFSSIKGAGPMTNVGGKNCFCILSPPCRYPFR